MSSDNKYSFLKTIAGITALTSFVIIAADYIGKHKNIGWQEEAREVDVSKIKKYPPPFDFYLYSKSRDEKKQELATKRIKLHYKHSTNITHREEILKYLKKIWGPCAPRDMDHFNEQIAYNDFVGAYYRESPDAPERPVGFLRTIWRYTDNGVLVPEIFSNFNTLTNGNTWKSDEEKDTLILVDCGNFGKGLKGVAPTCIEGIYDKELPEFEKMVDAPNIITYSPDSPDAKRLHESVARHFKQELWKGQIFKNSRPDWPNVSEWLENSPYPFEYTRPDGYARDVKPMIYKGCDKIRQRHYNPNQIIFWEIKTTPKPSKPTISQ
ncbi:MAG: hypothetical protein V1870_02100 [Candidatus Aenigmatarchaeota archaeon]